MPAGLWDIPLSQLQLQAVAGFGNAVYEYMAHLWGAPGACDSLLRSNKSCSVSRVQGSGPVSGLGVGLGLGGLIGYPKPLTLNPQP